MKLKSQKTIRYILGIDPGTTETAYCLVKILADKFSIVEFKKAENYIVFMDVEMIIHEYHPEVAIEHLESFGMPVGKSVFETAYYIGELTQLCKHNNTDVYRIYRHDEKNQICHSVKANDGTIKQALVDIFAEHPEVNHGKGTKNHPDFFYGMKADCWSAFAICYTYYLLTKR